MNAIVLVVDRLHAGYVGACGNTWIETPSMDRLAFESTVFDQCLIDNPRLDVICDSLWQGRHPLCPAELFKETPTLPSLVGKTVAATTLMTDEPAVADHRLSNDFDHLVRLDRPDARRTADAIEETHLAGCFARIVQWLESAREPFLLWCHLSGLGGPWDAPMAFRERYAEAGDPDPPKSVEVPNRTLDKDYDPDELLGITQAYAGQVSLLDVCVGALMEMVHAMPGGRDTLLAFLSARGFPLGEHYHIGAGDNSLYAELVHVPMMIRFPGSLGQATRSQALVQSADLNATLLDWWEGVDRHELPGRASLMPLVREETEQTRDRLLVAGDERAIRTPAWFLRDAPEAELFAKPDDRWEVNNVADRCDDVVDSLRKALSESEQALRLGQLGNLSPLDEVLMTGLE